MDITSVEFFTLAFVVAMAIVAMMIGRRERGIPSTHILQLITEPDGGATADAEDCVLLERLENGRVRIRRTGLTLVPDETVNLVFTIRDEQCTIVEKKGIKKRGAVGEPVSGEVVVKFLRPVKYSMRYESQVMSTWATFTYDAASPEPKQVTLNY